LAVQPEFVPALKVMRWIYASQGNWDQARAVLQRERAAAGDAEAAGWRIIEAQLAATDDASKSEARRLLQEAVSDESVRGNDKVYAFEIALAYLHLGDREAALDWLERAEKAATHSFNLM